MKARAPIRRRRRGPRTRRGRAPRRSRRRSAASMKPRRRGGSGRAGAGAATRSRRRPARRHLPAPTRRGGAAGGGAGPRRGCVLGRRQVGRRRSRAVSRGSRRRAPQVVGGRASVASRPVGGHLGRRDRPGPAAPVSSVVEVRLVLGRRGAAAPQRAAGRAGAASARAGAGMATTRSAVASASRSAGSSTAPTRSFGCTAAGAKARGRSRIGRGWRSAAASGGAGPRRPRRAVDLVPRVRIATRLQCPPVEAVRRRGISEVPPAADGARALVAHLDRQRILRAGRGRQVAAIGRPSTGGSHRRRRRCPPAETVAGRLSTV